MTTLSYLFDNSILSLFYDFDVSIDDFVCVLINIFMSYIFWEQYSWIIYMYLGHYVLAMWVWIASWLMQFLEQTLSFYLFTWLFACMGKQNVASWLHELKLPFQLPSSYQPSRFMQGPLLYIVALACKGAPTHKI